MNIIQTQNNILVWLKKNSTGIKGLALHSFLMSIFLLKSVGCSMYIACSESNFPSTYFHGNYNGYEEDNNII